MSPPDFAATKWLPSLLEAIRDQPSPCARPLGVTSTKLKPAANTLGAPTKFMSNTVIGSKRTTIFLYILAYIMFDFSIAYGTLLSSLTCVHRPAFLRVVCLHARQGVKTSYNAKSRYYPVSTGVTGLYISCQAGPNLLELLYYVFDTRHTHKVPRRKCI